MHDQHTADVPHDVARRLSEQLEIAHMNVQANFSSDGTVTFDLDIWPSDDRGAAIGAQAAMLIQQAGYEIDDVVLNDQGSAWIQATATTDGDGDG